MSLSSTPSPSEAPSRTVIDVYTERGAEYPKRQNRTHGILNKKDRMDYLLVAYSLMTKRVPDGLQRILSKLPTDRLTVLKAFEPVGAQLSLWGIMKKVISYDMGEDIIAPSTRQIETVLLEMQDLFAPVKRVVYTSPVIPSPTAPPPEPVKERVTEARTFMGFPVVDPYILAILDGLQVEEPKAAEETPKHAPLVAKKTLSPGVATVVHTIPTKIAPLLPHADTQRFQPRILPPAPRRGFTRQHWGRTRPFIPDHLRSQPPYPIENGEQITPEPTREVVSVVYEFPDFPDFPSALVWLRSQKKWEDFFRSILDARDELAVSLFLRDKKELIALFLKLTAQFNITRKAIAEKVLFPDPDETSEPESANEESSESPDEDNTYKYFRMFDIIKMNDEWMAVIRSICDLHMSGAHADFVVTINAFFSEYKKKKKGNQLHITIDNALDGLRDLRHAVDAEEHIRDTSPDKTDEAPKVSKMQLMFELCSYEVGNEKNQKKIFIFDEKERSLYLQYQWATRIAQLLIESGQADVFRQLMSLDDESQLIEGLKTISIKIPRGNKHKWAGYDEKTALETKLYFVFEDMVEHQHRGQEWNGHVTIDELKDLMKKIDVPKT